MHYRSLRGTLAKVLYLENYIYLKNNNIRKEMKCAIKQECVIIIKNIIFEVMNTTWFSNIYLFENK